MMTLDHVRQLLSRCRYKPGSELKCEPYCEGLGGLGRLSTLRGEHQCDVLIHISLKVVDVRTGCDTFVRGSYTLKEEDLREMNEHTFLERLRKEIVRSEEHEIDEWFLVDGNCYNEPHPERRGDVKWHQKEPNTDASQRIPPRGNDPWKTRWPGFDPVSKEAMVKPEDVTFPVMPPMPMSKRQREEMEKLTGLMKKDLLEQTASAMRSGRMKATSTMTNQNSPMLRETMLKGEPRRKNPMPQPKPRAPKKIKYNATSAMGLKIQSSGTSRSRSSQRNK